MKKTLLFCDRHDGAHPAITSVWIRTAGMSRIAKFDLCEEAFNAIMGTVSSNGTAPTPAPKHRGGRPSHGGFGADANSDTGKFLKVVRQFIARTATPFDLETLQTYCKVPEKRISILRRILQELVKQGELQRLTLGLFQKPGPSIPRGPTAPNEQAAVMAKYIQSHPGVRSAYLPILLGLDRRSALAVLRKMREQKLIRIKGTRLMTQLFPVTARS